MASKRSERRKDDYAYRMWAKRQRALERAATRELEPQHAVLDRAEVSGGLPR